MNEYITVWKDHEPTKLRWGVPVVRCRNCKHANHYHPLDYRTGKPHETLEEWYCDWHSNPEGASEIDPDGFCAWSERRKQ